MISSSEPNRPVRYRHGLIIGKFYPPHHGHDHLIRSALRVCDRVTVELIGSSGESIPLADRAAWLRESHPTIHLMTEIDDTPVDFDSASAWDAHMRTIRRLLDAPVDAVFSSDAYGAELARRLDAAWVQVDPGRRANPISGTAVRDDLFGWWPQLSAPVRAGLTRRIVVLGAESTGTTTLTTALAQSYSTSWVPEYGREYSTIRPGGPTEPWRSDEFDLIVDRQIRLETAAARVAPTPLLFCDTDALATSLWHERYVGSPSPTVVAAANAHRPLFYILTGDEIPFVDDGMRDGEHIRHDMARRFREVLAEQSVPWIEVRGSVEQRLHAARTALRDIIDERFRFSPPL
ncbi:hypothetical protein GOEFS_008_00250 [Gordonia effusa NBRC 100432]|uniref:NadR/Ttd14 AAA domain-containing protein n=1 Tax=Gordonia effusa NBRC 100432 TaxID=1077974 RepID=H0QUW5_9ACTN|nr:AAA family ATPase [Gordonia effusa]GAB16616.1 hypothetical protein GOEFS_008_00250 [Gordonia effusa NBRC 100432]